MIKAIVNGKIILTDGIIWNGTLVIKDDRILSVGDADKVEIPQGAEIIDANGLYVAPGFIDIHNHGFGTKLFVDDAQNCIDELVPHGVTTVLPTFYSNLSAERMIEGSRVIRELSKSGTGRMMNGLYMEGPYMRAGSGSFNSQLLWKGDINKTEYNPLLEEFGDMVRVWAIDPARDGIVGFMKDVKVNNPNAIFALGHSRATTEECRRVKDLGVKVQTHHGDSGQVKGKAQGTPGAGCDEFTLYDPDMYAELIVDQVGIHVVPDRVKMVIRTKGVERMILISDSMPHDNDYKNNAEAGIEYGPDLNYDDAGCLAGSRLSIDNAVRNVMTHSGYGLCHAVRFASYNPARMLGIADEVGSLEAGKIANVILIDDQVRVKRSFLYGDEIYKA